jgi:hypothetical protein
MRVIALYDDNYDNYFISEYGQVFDSTCDFLIYLNENNEQAEVRGFNEFMPIEGYSYTYTEKSIIINIAISDCCSSLVNLNRREAFELLWKNSKTRW